MALDGLITEATHDSDGEQDVDIPNSIRDLARVKFQKDKLHKPELCPECGSSNTEQHKYYWRCLDDDCDVSTYHSSSYTVNVGELPE